MTNTVSWPDIGFVPLWMDEVGDRPYGPWPPLDCYVKIILRTGELFDGYVLPAEPFQDRVGPLIRLVNPTSDKTYTLKEVQSWAKYDIVAKKLISNGLREPTTAPEVVYVPAPGQGNLPTTTIFNRERERGEGNGLTVLASGEVLPNKEPSPPEVIPT